MELVACSQVKTFHGYLVQLMMMLMMMYFDGMDFNFDFDFEIQSCWLSCDRLIMLLRLPELSV